MRLEIPGRETIEIKDVILDYNGTLAIDGKLIEGIAQKINRFSEWINFHVVTADTYGSVAAQLEGVNCTVLNLSTNKQHLNKLAYLNHLGTNTTLCVGNGFNDQEMLKHAILGIALLQSEGLCTPTLLASDIVCLSIFDVFNYFEHPNRLKATLRI